MRTTILIDDALINEAFTYANVTTKRELIDKALREFVAQHRRLDVRNFRGTVRFRRGYDHKKLRAERS